MNDNMNPIHHAVGVMEAQVLQNATRTLHEAIKSIPQDTPDKHDLFHRALWALGVFEVKIVERIAGRV